MNIWIGYFIVDFHYSRSTYTNYNLYFLLLFFVLRWSSVCSGSFFFHLSLSLDHKRSLFSTIFHASNTFVTTFTLAIQSHLHLCTSLVCIEFWNNCTLTEFVHFLFCGYLTVVSITFLLIKLSIIVLFFSQISDNMYLGNLRLYYSAVWCTHKHT